MFAFSGIAALLRLVVGISDDVDADPAPPHLFRVIRRVRRATHPAENL
ncbi:hypothetical protein [Nocardia sp. NPDC058244]